MSEQLNTPPNEPPSQEDLERVWKDNVRTNQIGGVTDGMTPEVAEDLGFKPPWAYDSPAVPNDEPSPPVPKKKTREGKYTDVMSDFPRTDTQEYRPLTKEEEQIGKARIEDTRRHLEDIRKKREAEDSNDDSSNEKDNKEDDDKKDGDED